MLRGLCADGGLGSVRVPALTSAGEDTHNVFVCVSLETVMFLRGLSCAQSLRAQLPGWGVDRKGPLVPGLPQGSQGDIYLGDEEVQ